MKIVISGSSGFVGTNLSAHFIDEGFTVDGLSLRNQWNFPIDADVFIHLAGKAHDTENTTEDLEYYRINSELTAQVFDQFISSNCKDFFYFSSVKAVADTVSGILTEDQDPHPLTPYGKSKLEAERYLLSKRLPSGKRLFIIRPCMIHGPGNKGNLNLLFNIVQTGLPWPLAEFKNKRSFLSVDNLNYLITKMINEDAINSGVYNVADDNPVSTNELIQYIARSINKKEILIRVPSSIITAVAKVGDVLKLPLNSERLKKLTENYVVSNNKIKKELGIEKFPCSVEEGLIKTLKSFKK